MRQESAIEIKAYGAWNGGTLTDNSIYENKGMSFKGDTPVNMKSIEERIGIRTRMVAPGDARVGVIALHALPDRPAEKRGYFHHFQACHGIL